MASALEELGSVDALELIEEAPCGFVATNLDGVIQYANRTFQEWIGRPADEFIQRQRFSDQLSVAGRLYYETHIAPLLHMQGFVNEIACNLLREDSKPLPILANFKLKCDAGNRPARVYVTAFKATDRRKYEEELRQARREAERLAAIVRFSNDAIVSTTLDGQITSWNNAAERLFGYSSAEIVGESIDCIIPPALVPEHEEIIGRLRHGEGIQNYETHRLTKDGREIYISFTISPILDETGMIVGASRIARDITERKQSEEQVKLLTDEVHHRSKNLLTVVQAIARQTARTSEPGQFTEHFSQRLAGLAASMDLLARGGWRETNLIDLIHSQLTHFSNLIGTRIVVDGPPLRCNDRAAQSIGMALHELATNSSKYGALSSATGRVNISWSVTQGDDASLDLSWTEEGGPPVCEPSRRGFGYTVVVQMVSSALRGQASIDYHPDGVRWHLTAPARNALVQE